MFENDSLKIKDYAKELENHLKYLEERNGSEYYSIEKMARERIKEFQ